MGFRFRKRVGPFDFSKTGISLSIGRRGFTVNTPIVSTRGRRGARLTVGLPGSGLSYSTRLSKSSGHQAEPYGWVANLIIAGICIWILVWLFG